LHKGRVILGLYAGHDPEQFWRDNAERPGQIAALARDARERLGRRF
jgi:hypothetical protein